MDKRNYVIAGYWEGDSGSLRSYMIHGNDIFNGTIDEARNTLAYVRRVRPDNRWHIFFIEDHYQADE